MAAQAFGKASQQAPKRSAEQHEEELDPSRAKRAKATLVHHGSHHQSAPGSASLPVPHTSVGTTAVESSVLPETKGRKKKRNKGFSKMMNRHDHHNDIFIQQAYRNKGEYFN
jgi:hypothetical protein